MIIGIIIHFFFSFFWFPISMWNYNVPYHNAKPCITSKLSRIIIYKYHCIAGALPWPCTLTVHGSLRRSNTRRDPSRLLISMPGARRWVASASTSRKVWRKDNDKANWLSARYLPRLLLLMPVRRHLWGSFFQLELDILEVIRSVDFFFFLLHDFNSSGLGCFSIWGWWLYRYACHLQCVCFHYHVCQS